MHVRIEETKNCYQQLFATYIGDIWSKFLICTWSLRTAQELVNYGGLRVSRRKKYLWRGKLSLSVIRVYFFNSLFFAIIFAHTYRHDRNQKNTIIVIKKKRIKREILFAQRFDDLESFILNYHIFNHFWDTLSISCSWNFDSGWFIVEHISY